MQFLKQSTAFTFRIGPFVDATDGVTAETGLTIGQGDILISKNGGAFAQTSAAPTTTHDMDGWYQCPLTATDTETLGTLEVQIVISGALPVWKHFTVVAANIYDSMIGASDKLDVDAYQITNDAITAAALNANAVTEIQAGLATSAAQANQALEASLTAIKGAGWTIETLKAIYDQVLLRLLTSAYTVPDNASIAAIKAKTDNLPSDPADESQIQAAIAAVQADTNDIQTRLPAALVDGRMVSDMAAISGDATAANNLEAALDGTGGVDLDLKQLHLSNPAGPGLLVESSAIAGSALKISQTDAFVGGKAVEIVAAGALSVGVDVQGGLRGIEAEAIESNGIGASFHGDPSTGYGVAFSGHTAINANGNVLDIVGQFDGSFGTQAKADINAEVVDVLRTDMIPDSYAADAAQPTFAQAVLEILQFLTEKAVVGTTVTVNKPDGSTAAMTFTLDSATAPTTITRAT